MTLLQKHLVFGPFCFAAFVGLFGGLTMLLWNWLMPAVFGLPAINFWQAIGLLLLSKILFGSFGHGHHGHKHCGENKLRRRWESMSPEERERFVEEHRNCSAHSSC